MIGGPRRGCYFLAEQITRIVPVVALGAPVVTSVSSEPPE